MAFPTTLDNLSATSPGPTDTMASVSHSGQHSAANTAIDALETKVGINGSAVTTSLDYLTKRAFVDETAITDAASITVSLDGVASQILNTYQNPTITCSGMTASVYKSVKILITAMNSTRTVTLNSSIKFLDRTGPSFAIASGKHALLVLESWGSALTDVYASVGLET